MPISRRQHGGPRVVPSAPAPIRTRSSAPAPQPDLCHVGEPHALTLSTRKVDLQNQHSETCICEVSGMCAISCFSPVLASLSQKPGSGAGPRLVCPGRTQTHPPSNNHRSITTRTRAHSLKLTTAVTLTMLPQDETVWPSHGPCPDRPHHHKL
jgi:hypothetical protein